MEITTYSKFRQHLKGFFNKVVESHSPLFITQQNGEDLVLMSKSDYEGLQETFYLLRNPKNASRLRAALDEYENGGGTERDMIE